MPAKREPLSLLRNGWFQKYKSNLMTFRCFYDVGTDFKTLFHEKINIPAWL
jgi:hypothetical protein